jgi:ribonucleoside-diphosphate reductase beta chain
VLFRSPATDKVDNELLPPMQQAANELDTPEPSTASVGELPLNAKAVNADDKRVVNGLADINQLAPFKYPWAWNYFLNANKNHWTPLDINMELLLKRQQKPLDTARYQHGTRRS